MAKFNDYINENIAEAKGLEQDWLMTTFEVSDNKKQLFFKGAISLVQLSKWYLLCIETMHVIKYLRMHNMVRYLQVVELLKRFLVHR